MKESANSKIHISSNFLLSLCESCNSQNILTSVVYQAFPEFNGLLTRT
jgi:hypothetical protein